MLVVCEPAFTSHLTDGPCPGSPSEPPTRANCRAVLLTLVSRINPFLDTRSPAGGPSHQMFYIQSILRLAHRDRYVHGFKFEGRNSIGGSRIRQMLRGSHSTIMTEVGRVSLPLLNAYHFWEQFMGTLHSGSSSSRELPGRWQFRRALPGLVIGGKVGWSSASSSEACRVQFEGYFCGKTANEKKSSFWSRTLPIYVFVPRISGKLVGCGSCGPHTHTRLPAFALSQSYLLLPRATPFH